MMVNVAKVGSGTEADPYRPDLEPGISWVLVAENPTKTIWVVEIEE